MKKQERNQYNIHKDFEQWKDFNPPLGSKFGLYFFQKLMGLLKGKIKSDETCNAQKLKIPYGKKRKMNAVLYSPKIIEKNAPCLIYIHGGGFVLPGAPHHYNNSKKYALGASCKVLYLDYPLSPQNKYPEAVNACFGAYKWLKKNASNLDIDQTKIIVGGDSAGGNLSSIVCLKASDENIEGPIAQMLIYPAINSGYNTTSMRIYTDTPLCNSEDCKKYQDYYFKKDEDKYCRYVSPLNAESAKIYPTTYVETAEFDCLRDEARIFARVLRNAGVSVSLNNTKETMHGYDMVEDSKITIENMQKRINFLKEVFEK